MARAKDLGLSRKRNYTTGEVAAHCEVAPRTVSQWFDSGKLKGYRIPGGTSGTTDRRIPRECLIEFLKEHKIPLGTLETAGRRVLLVGVGPHVSSRLSRDLTEFDGWRFLPAADAFEAGAIFRSERPVAAVLDFSFGRSDAIRMAKTMRAKDPGVILIAVTAEDELPELAVFEGFDQALQSPVSAEAIADVLVCETGVREELARNRHGATAK